MTPFTPRPTRLPRLTRPARREKPRGSRRTHPALWLFPVPALVLYVLFFASPTVQAFQYAVTDWNGYEDTYRNVGMENFSDLATNDDMFSRALGNNLTFMFTVVVFQTLFALVFAVYLAATSRSSVFLRALFFFPTILSSVSVAFVWRFVYDPGFGLANRGLDAVGLGGLRSSYLGDPQQAIYFVALTQIWFHTGQMMVIYIAGLQVIPRELYEAAEVDGASRWKQFRFVTWPLLAPATAIVVAYTTIQSFKAFDLILGLSGNPPKPSLDILSTRIFSTFSNSEYGYAAAESVLFMIVIAMVTFLQRRAVRILQAGT
ncbi:carbohydrate ABC transporter permease [Streptomyces sp. PT12]|uniref:carbohydrate ABC transporter permease n=1 Tax=Streptomyces sp. PT12 TaxID=1510197 RepID=UPI000DE3C23B|nr:sugar ABC transporter permease [Streptomyces sp. PT12]RBM14402.1 ABC transporter permease [Streptomyces sp. PT12]